MTRCNRCGQEITFTQFWARGDHGKFYHWNCQVTYFFWPMVLNALSTGLYRLGDRLAHLSFELEQRATLARCPKP